MRSESSKHPTNKRFIASDANPTNRGAFFTVLHFVIFIFSAKNCGVFWTLVVFYVVCCAVVYTYTAENAL
jgi:4-hydroxybenzoate polyprenyltransferase